MFHFNTSYCFILHPGKCNEPYSPDQGSVMWKCANIVMAIKVNLNNATYGFACAMWTCECWRVYVWVCKCVYMWINPYIKHKWLDVWLQPDERLSHLQGLKWASLAAVEDNIDWESIENRTMKRRKKRHVKYANQGKKGTALSYQDLGKWIEEEKRNHMSVSRKFVLLNYFLASNRSNA